MCSAWSEVVVRGGVEPPTFRFSGVADTQLRPGLPVCAAVCGCVRTLVAAVVAVTVAVSPAMSAAGVTSCS